MLTSKRNSAPLRPSPPPIPIERTREDDPVEERAEKRPTTLPNPGAGPTCPKCNSQQVALAEAGNIFFRCTDASCGHEVAFQQRESSRSRRRS